VEADRLVEAAAMLSPVEFVGQEIRQLARAFSEGLIEGAGTAVMVLEVTRDVSFAVAASVGAVVAAPFERERRHSILHVGRLGRPDDWRHHRLLLKKPDERHLRSGHASLLVDLSKPRHDGLVQLSRGIVLLANVPRGSGAASGAY